MFHRGAPPHLTLSLTCCPSPHCFFLLLRCPLLRRLPNRRPPRCSSASPAVATSLAPFPQLLGLATLLLGTAVYSELLPLPAAVVHRAGSGSGVDKGGGKRDNTAAAALARSPGRSPFLVRQAARKAAQEPAGGGRVAVQLPRAGARSHEV